MGLGLLEDLVNYFDPKIPWEKNPVWNSPPLYVKPLQDYLLWKSVPSFCNLIIRNHGNLKPDKKTFKTLKGQQYFTTCYNVILVFDSNKFMLPMDESLLIKHDKPVLNRTVNPSALDLFLTNHLVFTFYKHKICFQYWKCFLRKSKTYMDP